MTMHGDEDAILHHPLKNKGLAFSHAERAALGIEALLPAAVRSQAAQAKQAYQHIASMHEPLAKYRELMSLQDRNEYLFYRVLLDNLPELMPIVYTPTVGEAAQKYSSVFQRGRGLWLTPEHRGRMQDVIARATAGRDVRLLVVTDNEAILGIGDQGVGGMTISIGKLSLYTACAGIAPEHTLPISLDVGTDNQALREDPGYVGLDQPRVRGQAYDDLVEEFVAAIEALFPGALIQWEDFRKDNALTLLDRYRARVPSFNDDIQGTGAVTLAGVYSALRILNAKLSDQRFLIHGAGAAGLGIARQIKAALLEEGVARSELDKHIGLLDSRGLLVDDTPISDSYKSELAWQAASAQALGIDADRSLETVVTKFKPTILIGSSGQAGAFSKTIVDTMTSYCTAPVIMPLSNPTSSAEATPEDLVGWTAGRALVATGSPFAPVRYEGRDYRFGQGNNVFIFPALGFASLHGQVTQVTDGMITAAAKALAENVSDEELEAGLLYPDVSRLRAVTQAVSGAVLKAAFAEAETQMQRPDDIDAFVAARMWVPDYEA